MKNNLIKPILVSQKHQRLFLSVLTLSVICVSFSFASPVADPKIVSGTKSLLQAISAWITGLIPLATACVAAYFGLLKTMAQDDADIADKNKKMRGVILAGIVATCISGLAYVILDFYK